MARSPRPNPLTKFPNYPLSSGLLSLHPLRGKVGIHQPADRLQHGLNSLLHVGEINVGDIVARAVIVLVKSKAGNGVSNDALARQGKII